MPTRSGDFVQAPPQLPDPYAADPCLREYLRRELPSDVHAAVEPDLVAMAGIVTNELYGLQLADRLNEPRLVQWDAWGNRIDAIELTALWHRAAELAARHGLVASAYERRHGPFSRLHQFALVYLFHPSSDLYTCPLAMTDGAARTLLDSGNDSLVRRAVPHLTARDPRSFWTSGQWMTELAGGSDVGGSQTTAERHSDGDWRLTGRKWFTSAATSQVALTLARPVGNPAGGKGLALFYVETRDADGRPRGYRIERLKDKLGTRKLPTAELTLEGTPAIAVQGTDNGIRNITPMLNITRTWNSVVAASVMRRGVMLATEYARRRHAFGGPLIDKPLHADTLAMLEAETRAAFHLSFLLAGLVGKIETGVADESERGQLRLLAAVVKLTTARMAVSVLDEVMECFGGAGYVEDTGIPALVRDSHVLPIWEGTTNVLALEALDAALRDDALRALVRCAQRAVAGGGDAALTNLGAAALAALCEAQAWLQAGQGNVMKLEAGARRFALTVGRSLALALLVEQAQWSLKEGSVTALDAAVRFAAHGINLIARSSAVPLKSANGP